MIVHIDSFFAHFYLNYWPRSLGIIYFVGVGDYKESYVRIQWFSRKIKPLI